MKSATDPVRGTIGSVFTENHGYTKARIDMGTVSTDTRDCCRQATICVNGPPNKSGKRATF